MMIAAIGHVGAGETALRLAVGAVFGAVIGVEREYDGHDAGLRTHVLLALGSALFGVVSVGAFGSFIVGRNSTDITLDPSRIASYVAAGIGFIGGGVILKQGDRVKGLTTAASLWTASAVGLASGLGFWVGAAVATGLATAVLIAEYPLRAIGTRGGNHQRSHQAGGGAARAPTPRGDRRDEERTASGGEEPVEE